MDLILYNTVINSLWYLFTVVFLLYKFTSFFSYVINFATFCGSTIGWIRWLVEKGKEFYRKQNGYVNVDPENPHNEHLLPSAQKSTFFSKIKSGFAWVYSFWSGSTTTEPELEQELPTINPLPRGPDLIVSSMNDSVDSSNLSSSHQNPLMQSSFINRVIRGEDTVPYNSNPMNLPFAKTPLDESTRRSLYFEAQQSPFI